MEPETWDGKRAVRGDEPVPTVRRVTRKALMLTPVLVLLMGLARGPTVGQASSGADTGDGTVAVVGKTYTHVAPSADAMVVLADPSDPYYALAGGIALAEGSRLVTSPDEALAGDPEFLLWVVSPAWMSDQTLVELGLAMHARDSVVSVGIISGSTMEQARQLWQRGKEVEARLVVAANAANVSAHVPGIILVLGPGGEKGRVLTMEDLTRYLQRADYLTFTGHGGHRYLRLDERTKLLAADLPELSAIVVATASCNTFRIWEDDSIALAFVDSGAAAYAGFAYSPNEGYLLGEFYGVPLRYTWPGFPVGHVVQLQNLGTVKGFASFPYYYLLGDPRIALQSEPPYQQVGDREEGATRVLDYSGAPMGFIPLRIPGGAKYEFVEIPGVGSSWDHDCFYNSYLQTAGIGDDKLVLFWYGGGDFTVRLHEKAPWYWVAWDVLSDSLDHTLLYLPQSSGDIIALFLGGLAWLTIVSVAWRARRGKSLLLAGAGAGVVLAILHGVYAWARLDHVTITSKAVHGSLPALVGTLLITGAGACLFVGAKSWRGRVLGLVVGTLPTCAAIVFSLVLVAGANYIVFRPELGTGAYNYALALLPVPALLAQSAALLVCYALLSCVTARLRRGSSVSFDP
jgi:uncharacterized membrane protein